MFQPRLHLTDIGWVLDVPHALPAQTLARIAKWALPHQLDRLRSLPPGDRYDALSDACKLLQQGKIIQRVVGQRGNSLGDIVGFQATKATSTKLISLPGVKV